MTDLVKRLEQLLVSLSDGEWEHGLGITIENLDNPGWSIRVCLDGTPFDHLIVSPRMTERSDRDWIHLATEKNGHDTFLVCACGPENLSEALATILDLLDQPA
ncbi:Imm53 family immunity protein [Terricaulis silvestris]|uniref:Uncharacterized protein n=1 Tax=Terricaulis silvestris TaxID=2686094 RepID=A0A6I6MNJ4_9CAUL|nr:Imm53 family immunity protein [Terricaulis silvestris]QGZ94504.1 hypothetical protein DSM104635_01323 [Terricaulis silvestris]